MPQGLPERINIIITTQKNFKPCRGLYFMDDIDVILEYGINCFIIGGASIYKKFLPYANELYISTILRNYKGDTFFPEIYWNNWKVDRKEEYSEFIFEKFVKKSCL
jgi:dihydrofolate reductase